MRFFILAVALAGLRFTLHLSGIEKNILGVRRIYTYCGISQGIIALIAQLSQVWPAWQETTKMRAHKTA